jgi:hypothetical protein
VIDALEVSTMLKSLGFASPACPKSIFTITAILFEIKS